MALLYIFDILLITFDDNLSKPQDLVSCNHVTIKVLRQTEI